MQTRVYRMWMWVREWHVCTCADVLSTAESTHAHANIPTFISYNSTSKLLILFLRLSCKSDYATWKRRHAVWRDVSWYGCRICVWFYSSLGKAFHYSLFVCLLIICWLWWSERKFDALLRITTWVHLALLCPMCAASVADRLMCLLLM